MIEPIRLATQEEIDRIKETADLSLGTSVWAFGQGEKADFAVLRSCWELDPLICHNGNQRKAIFVWGIENMLRALNVPQYYFNLDPEDTSWIETVKKWGAEQVSRKPDLRFKKEL